MKKLIALLMLGILTLTLASCGQKLVSDACVMCGEKATHNYTNGNLELKVSLNGGEEFTLAVGQTVAVCDTHFSMMEMAGGKSK